LKINNVDNKEFDEFLDSIKPTIGWTIDNILKRGYEEISQDIDDYSFLLDKYEFRNLIVFELYENYFLPQRHEFELQILKDIVEAVVNYKPLVYIAGAAATGVIGNTIYDLLKHLLSYVFAKFKDKDVRRGKAFGTIKNDICKIEKYFKEHKSGKIEELEKRLNIERNRLLPLLKLLGFKCCRRRRKNLWVRPD